MDFVQGWTADGRPLRMLVVLDEYTRECLAIEMRRNLRGKDVVAVLGELTTIRGALAHLRADNGPEMISKAVKEWCVAPEPLVGRLAHEPKRPRCLRHGRWGVEGLSDQSRARHRQEDTEIPSRTSFTR